MKTTKLLSILALIMLLASCKQSLLSSRYKHLNKIAHTQNEEVTEEKTAIVPTLNTKEKQVRNEIGLNVKSNTETVSASTSTQNTLQQSFHAQKQKAVQRASANHNSTTKILNKAEDDKKANDDKPKSSYAKKSLLFLLIASALFYLGIRIAIFSPSLIVVGMLALIVGFLAFIFAVRNYSKFIKSGSLSSTKSKIFTVLLTIALILSVVLLGSAITYIYN